MQGEGLSWKKGVEDKTIKPPSLIQYKMTNTAKMKEFTLDSDTAYLTGIIIGDGNIGSSLRSFPPLKEIDPRITIEIGDGTFLKEIIAPVIQKVLQRKKKCAVSERKREERKHNSTWATQVRSKYFHKFLTETLALPKGKKAAIVSIERIIELTKENETARLALLAGIFDSDGGLRGNSIGQSTASLKLRDEVVSLLRENGMSVIVGEWMNKKYNRKYYDWKIRRLTSIRDFVLKVPLRNIEKLNRIKKRFNLNAGGRISTKPFS